MLTFVIVEAGEGLILPSCVVALQKRGRSLGA